MGPGWRELAVQRPACRPGPRKRDRETRRRWSGTRTRTAATHRDERLQLGDVADRANALGQLLIGHAKHARPVVLVVVLRICAFDALPLRIPDDLECFVLKQVARAARMRMQAESQRILHTRGAQHPPLCSATAQACRMPSCAMLPGRVHTPKCGCCLHTTVWMLPPHHKQRCPQSVDAASTPQCGCCLLQTPLTWGCCLHMQTPLTWGCTSQTRPPASKTAWTPPPLDTCA
jgi:hypothetical protein